MTFRDGAVILLLLVGVVPAWAGCQKTRGKSIVLATAPGTVLGTKYVFVVESGNNYQSGRSAVKRVYTRLRDDGSNIVIFSKSAWSNYGLTSIRGSKSSTPVAILSRDFDSSTSPKLKSWGLPVVLHSKEQLNWATSLNAIGRKLYGVHQYPCTLTNLEGVAGVVDVEYNPTETEQRYYDSDSCNPIELLGHTKLRATIFFLLGISLVIFGAVFVSYGERLWNFKHTFSWWTGCTICGVGGWMVLTVLSSVVAHWLFP